MQPIQIFRFNFFDVCAIRISKASATKNIPNDFHGEMVFALIATNEIKMLNEKGIDKTNGGQRVTFTLFRWGFRVSCVDCIWPGDFWRRQFTFLKKLFIFVQLRIFNHFNRMENRNEHQRKIFSKRNPFISLLIYNAQVTLNPSTSYTRSNNSRWWKKHMNLAPTYNAMHYKRII